jgi:hypothetical protein
MADIRTTSKCGCKGGKRGPVGPAGPAGPAGQAGPSSGALIGRQVFDTAGSGTYTPTPGTTRAIVRGCGGGGGGGGVGAPGASDAAGAAGANSGTSIEIEVKAAPNTLLTGGAFTVGAGAPGMIGNGAISTGEDSTLTIGGVTLTAPGGIGGNSGGSGFIPPVIIPPTAQTLATGVDYQAADVGEPGITIANNSNATRGGNGGSGDFGIGGNGSSLGNGGDAAGNGAGGGGGSTVGASAGPAVNGGAGAPGIWIIEEYS